MNLDEDTCEWLGCPTPLEMYQHQCALLEDELTATQKRLTEARRNIAGLVQMCDLLVTGKATAEAELKNALDRISSMSDEAPNNMSFRPIDLVTNQRDHLFRENQRLRLELIVLRGPQP
ncbi:hypothetical protein HX810_20410 [Pseudomonas salomonii]|uniref:Uncharacterized protein n=1 Tax=Pseudomonas salomonii TaxID=191391 RepID=A0A7Y8GHC2_9PSED|nr:hypothetical protein [Pseudomonas salomonii]NWF10038.1 hypothetical protein [Pseudomonas salomonii]